MKISHLKFSRVKDYSYIYIIIKKKDMAKEDIETDEKLSIGDTFKMNWFELDGEKDIVVTAKVIRINRLTITLEIVGKGYTTRLTPEKIQNRLIKVTNK